MIRAEPKPNNCWALALVSLLCGCLAGSSVQGDRFLERLEEKPEQESSANRRNHNRLNRSNIFHWIFNSSIQEDQYEEKLQETLQSYISLLDERCSLTPRQRAKLELAGGLDIQRFSQEVDKILAYYDSLPDNANWNELINTIYQRIQPLRKQYSAGMFRTGSLFERTVPLSLTDSQREQWGQAELARRKFAFRAVVNRYIQTLEGYSPLSASERDSLVGFFMEEVEPPRQIGRRHASTNFFHWQLSLLEEEKVKSIYPPRFHKWILRQRKNGKRWGDYLVNNGWTFERDVK